MIDDLRIDSVIINGQKVEPIHDCYYQCDFLQNPDIVVNYTLHNRQVLSTNYTSEFNSSLPNADLSLVSEIEISETNVVLYKNETLQLSVTLYPVIAENKDIVWTSSDENVATVDSNGKVTGIAFGNTIITAKCDNASATCEVCVSPVLVEQLIVCPDVVSGEIGEYVQLSVQVFPEDAADKSVSWTSSNEKVATVDETGLVCIHRDRFCVIRASANDGSGVVGTCTVNGLSGIDAILSDGDGVVDVYSTSGVLLKKGCDEAQLRQLAPGVYILRSDNGVSKIVVK